MVLTASGGPFRGRRAAELEGATAEQALRHPTWRMGQKITVDSATLMNKALEVIEARWLFGLGRDQIDVVIHPESVVHSFVEFVDGSVLAQLSPPDMRLPIQYALTYPDRVPGPARRLDWAALSALRFEPPDRDTFRALDLGFEVAAAGRHVRGRAQRRERGGRRPVPGRRPGVPGHRPLLPGRAGRPRLRAPSRRSTACWRSTAGPGRRSPAGRARGVRDRCRGRRPTAQTKTGRPAWEPMLRRPAFPFAVYSLNSPE